jgi:hypothetical protein
VASDDETLGLDPSHPIPHVFAYDVVLTFDGGGAFLGIMIASPLGDDARSRARLNEKLRFYMESFFSDYGKKEWDAPKEGRMKIFVKIHQDSTATSFEVIEEAKVQAARRGIEMIVTKWLPPVADAGK